MKKLITLAVLLPTMAAAQQTSDDTLVIKKPTEITIVKSKNETTVEIKGQENDPDYHYQLKMRKELNSYTEEKVSNWNFDFIVNKKKSRTVFPIEDQKKRISTHRFESEISYGIEFNLGLVSAINTVPRFNIDMSRSFEFSINNIISSSYTFGNHGFHIGFGVNWRNYRMTEYTRFIKEGNHIVLGDYPENIDIGFSRIRIFSLTVPLMYTGRISENYLFRLGPVVNFNTGANLKTRYSERRKDVKIVDKNIHQTPVTFDFMAVIRYKAFGVYFKYSPDNVLKSEFGPQFKSFSVGVGVGI